MLAVQFLPLDYRSVFVFCLWVWQSENFSFKFLHNFKVLKSQSGPKTIMYNALCTYIYTLIHDKSWFYCH